jgi:hypothetical protein
MKFTALALVLLAHDTEAIEKEYPGFQHFHNWDGTPTQEML